MPVRVCSTIDGWYPNEEVDLHLNHLYIYRLPQLRVFSDPRTAYLRTST